VTCTGYIAPNAAHTVSSKWAEKNHYTQVTNAYHMGCYASLPAIRIARGICLSKESSNVDIAHTEICSLHFDPTTLETMQIIVQSLFADGHIKYRLSDFQPKLGFQILALNEQTIPESLNMMTWVPNTQAFGMTLSKDIPLTIAPHLQKFVDELLSQAQIDNLSPIYFAIHPGGPKIIEGVEMMLDLSQEMTSESHEILAEYGNMSSSTLPHIWDRILKNEKRVDGAYVVSLGFGPGLTMSGAVFKICRT
jgi:predicted naringenin-chalcone synthase